MKTFSGSTIRIIPTIHVEKEEASRAQFYLETQEDIVTLLDVIIETLMANTSALNVNADAPSQKRNGQ